MFLQGLFKKTLCNLKKAISARPSKIKNTIEIIESEFGNKDYLYDVFKQN